MIFEVIESKAFPNKGPALTGLPEFESFFENCSQAYIQQSSFWARVIEHSASDRCTFFLYKSSDGEVLASLPIYLYTAAAGAVAISVPQIGPIGGVSVSPKLPKELHSDVYQSLFEHAIRWARSNNCIALSLTTNPFSPDLEIYRKFFVSDFSLKNFTQYIELSSFFDSEMNILLKDYNIRSNLSRNVKKANSSDLAFCTLDFDSDGPEMYDLHVRHHTKLGVAPLPKLFLDSIQKYMVPDGKAFFWGVRKDQKILSWAVYIGHKDYLDAVRISVDPDAPDVAANYLLVDQSLRKAKALGFKVFNWQSSPSRDSGVYRFKKQWGSLEKEYFFLTKLLVAPEKIGAIGLTGLKSMYPLRFIVPYAAFREGQLLPGDYEK